MKKTMQNYAKDLKALNENTDLITRHLALQRNKIKQKVDYFMGDAEHKVGLKTCKDFFFF